MQGTLCGRRPSTRAVLTRDYPIQRNVERTAVRRCESPSRRCWPERRSRETTRRLSRPTCPVPPAEDHPSWRYSSVSRVPVDLVSHSVQRAARERLCQMAFRPECGGVEDDPGFYRRTRHVEYPCN